MSVIQLSNGTIIERRRSDKFFDNEGRQVEPPAENNCYTYAFGTWIKTKGENVYINPGYTYMDGRHLNHNKKMFIQKVLKDCKILGIECICIPIDGKKKKIRLSVKEAMKGVNKVLIKAFWAPRDKKDRWGQYGYYHFIRKAKDGRWLEVFGNFGGVSQWDEEPDEVIAGKTIKPVAYFVITE